MSRHVRKLLILLLTLGAPVLLGSNGDPGLLLVLDLESFELSARDLRDGAEGPRLRVSLGSPSHSTPAGTYPIYQVVRDPAWNPGPDARARGAQRLPASADGPLGVAKLPFAEGGIAVHGGGNPLLLGKPVSLGCVRTLNEDLIVLLDWMDDRSALEGVVPTPDGEQHQQVARSVHIVVR
jgi:hypothetical protein